MMSEADLRSMASGPSRSKRNRLVIVLFLAVGLAATLTLPFFVPVRPAASESYIFGFNNRAAMVIFLFFAGAFGWWVGVRPRIASGKTHKLSPGAITALFGVPTLLMLTTWWLTRASGGVNESTYFLDRLQHLSHGERIYRDFEFAYGPLSLYLPLLIARATSLSLTDAYYVAWITQWLLGLFVLWRVIESVCGTSPKKNAILLLMVLTWLPSVAGIGPNYTPLRFWIVPYAAILVYRRVAARRSLLGTAALAAAFTFALMLYSPEQSFSFAGATCLMLALFVFPRGRTLWLALLLFAAGVAATIGYAAREGYFYTMHAMASGGYNFPLLPAPHLIPLLGALVIAAWVFVDGLRFPRKAGVAQYLIATSLVALPAAFGRCDAGHLIINTVGATVVAWAVLASYPRAWRWACITYLLTVLVLPLPFLLFNARRIVSQSLKMRYTPERLAAMPSTGLQGRFRSIMLRHGTSAEVLARSDVLSRMPMPGGELLRAPFGLPVIVPMLNIAPRMTSGRFVGLQDVMLPEQVEDKIDELRAHPAEWLFVPKHFQCVYGPPSKRDLVFELYTLYFPPPRHELRLYEPLCAYIHRNYDSASVPLPLGEYELMRPHSLNGSSSP